MDSVNFSTASVTLSSNLPPHNLASFEDEGGPFVTVLPEEEEAEAHQTTNPFCWGLLGKLKIDI